MKSILLIGVGNFGQHIAKEITNLGHEVMAVDRNEENINTVMPYVTSALIGDSTNSDFLDSLGINNFDVCIVAIGDSFQSSLETTYLLKEKGAKKVIARACHDVQAKFLLSNGANQIIYPDEQLAKWTAISCCSNHLHNYIELDDDYSLFEIDVPENWIGKTISELKIREKYQINILAIKNGENKNYIIDPNYKFGENETILVLSSYQNIKENFKL